MLNKNKPNSELCETYRRRLQVTNEPHILSDYIPFDAELKEEPQT